MIHNPFAPPLPGTAAFELRRMRHIAMQRYTSSYRFIPAVRCLVNRSMVAAYRGVQATGDERALREAGRVVAWASLQGGPEGCA